MECEQRQERQQISGFPDLQYSRRSVRATEWGLLKKGVTVHGCFRNLFSLGNYNLSLWASLFWEVFWHLTEHDRSFGQNHAQTTTSMAITSQISRNFF